MHSSPDAKAQTLALLGSIDFSLEDLETNVLNTTVTPQIYAAMGGADMILAEEAAVCIKNLMTNELLGSKCTRRLHSLNILPLITQVLQNIINSDAKAAVSANFLEAIAVQILCIATTVPSALPELTASPLAALVAKRLALSNTIELAADNALLQALLVAVEDNEPLAHNLIQLNPQFLAVSFESGKFDPSHLNVLLRLMCLLQIIRSVPSADSALNLPIVLNFVFATLQSPLPAAALFETDPAAVKLFFEIAELATEALEILVASNGKCGQVLKGQSLESFLELPFLFLAYFQENFQNNFDTETNNDRIRLVCRIFSIVGTLIAIQEQLINSRIVKVTRGSGFVVRMEKILSLTAACPSEDYNVNDEVSGWIRSWLSAWGDSDYPNIPESFFTALIAVFFASSSPVVLTNTCALTSLLIPYAPELVQKDFCVFLNNLLCTDPFDPDHLEVLLAAVDGVTGIFDPKSKEWPAKPLSELKNDLKVAKERLQVASCVQTVQNDAGMKDIVTDRCRSIDRIYRIL